MSAKQSWHLYPASGAAFLGWSFGRVRAVDDLYSRRIFGPAADLTCECGKYHGEAAAGTICDVCGVLVARTSAVVRCERLGHLSLSRPCRHPYDGGPIIDVFPIAPIGFRVNDRLRPSALGLAYESLVRMNAEAGCLDGIGATQRPDAERSADDELSAAIRKIVGALDAESHGDTLLALLKNAIVRADLHVMALTRSCGLGLRVEVAV